ncbi:MAG: hypothetical protein HQK83_06770 [Fibrobacteria bacterium]|nr:hypothetical protein [Fibrobacteria bacterium]
MNKINTGKRSYSVITRLDRLIHPGYEPCDVYNSQFKLNNKIILCEMDCPVKPGNDTNVEINKNTIINQ